ncbi:MULTISPECIES: tubulin-like doman-containing protein [Paenibacillus]|uniref:tubulin-like doman-containing protein n=1 Tax=Paenibacillus TaxID=44249 RepID=UPI0010BA660A|nr:MULTISPECIES: tubulin-like doman-containing protein [Paenibacillus]GCL73101.1 hypothetical protein PN4B1_30370 [Paenibacillus naphthalenovorans]
MSFSMYHSASGMQSPHSIHVVGIGRTGVGFVDAMLREGEVEDLLEDPRARFSALAIDIGEQDMVRARDYAQGFLERLEERNIPRDRARIRTVSLEVPSKEELFGSLARYPEFLKREFLRYDWNPDYEPWLPDNIEIPKPGEHFPRALAKAIYGKNYYDGPQLLKRELKDFVQSVDQTRLPSMVLVCFSMGGGTGSGIAVDLARHLSTVHFGRRVPVIGVGVMPCSADDEKYRGASLFATLNELDCMIDDDKNKGVTQVWGDLYANPFTGGFFVANMEHVWQRISRYTDLGVPAVRQGLRLQVTNKFLADSFVRFAAHDSGRTLFRALRPCGFTGAPHETVSSKARNFTLYNLAKLTHPGVQVLPGEPLNKWRQILSDWLDHTEEWSGLVEGFKTDYAEVHIHAPRYVWNESVDRKLADTMNKHLLDSDEATLRTFHHEFFDHLTSYLDILLPGLAKTDLRLFWESRKRYANAAREEKLLNHSWLLDLGVLLSERSSQMKDMAGERLWGDDSWVAVPYDQLQGDVLPPATRREILQQGIAAMTKTVVPTP